MKNYYKISEISKLYGIGIDSLRYYEEIGLLRPKRDKNNYRLYSLRDLYKLNIIRELRPLHMSMSKIKDYTEQLSVDNTLHILQAERELVQERQRELADTDQSLAERIAAITAALALPIDQYTIRYLPARPCVQLNTNITRDEETDFAIQRLHKKYEHKIYNLGKNPIGATLSIEDLTDGTFGPFRSVFYVIAGENPQDFDFSLPEGEYLSYSYQGSYEQSSMQVKKLLTYAQQQGHTLDSDVYEIYHIDNRYTVRTEEFLTELQVKI